MAFEENEISKNANGGTELAKRRLAKIIDDKLLEEFQIIPSRIRDLDNEKIRVLWSHDLPEDPESQKTRDKQYRDKFHKFVFVSNWQYDRYQLINQFEYDDKSLVVEYGIEPSPITALQKDDGTIHIVYTSTPHRGLEILIPVFIELAKIYDNIHLDVFSSFKIYGWADADKQYQELFDIIKAHPQMTYHGFQPNDILRAHLNKSHIFAYPSIWLETSCLALIESMSSGLVCVHPNFGALPETSGGLNIMYQGNFQDKNRHANIFASYLRGAIDMVIDKKTESLIGFNKNYIDNRYNLERAKGKWEWILTDLLKQYPTIESRVAKKQTLIYKTS